MSDATKNVFLQDRKKCKTLNNVKSTLLCISGNFFHLMCSSPVPPSNFNTSKLFFFSFKFLSFFVNVHHIKCGALNQNIQQEMECQLNLCAAHIWQFIQYFCCYFHFEFAVVFAKHHKKNSLFILFSMRPSTNSFVFKMQTTYKYYLF